MRLGCVVVVLSISSKHQSHHYLWRAAAHLPCSHHEKTIFMKAWSLRADIQLWKLVLQKGSKQLAKCCVHATDRHCFSFLNNVLLDALCNLSNLIVIGVQSWVFKYTSMNGPYFKIRKTIKRLFNSIQSFEQGKSLIFYYFSFFRRVSATIPPVTWMNRSNLCVIL